MTDDTTRPDTPQADPAGASPSIGAAAAHGAPKGEASTPPEATTSQAQATTPPLATKRRSPFYLRGRRLRLPRSRRGLAALLLVLSGLGGVAVFSTVSLIQWTETADFCGRCHSMAPELAAYEAGPHANVTCGECHVEPGVTGWIKAKMNGTRQLVEMVLGTYPTPIPPPEHTDLPSADDTCAHCHDPLRRALAGLKTRTVFSEDEANTRQFVGLMIRPGGGDAFDVDRSVHWHILRDVSYSTADKDATSIDYVAATQPDGSVREYIAQDKVRVTEDVQPDIDEIKAAEPQRLMNCYDCHNRAGHDIPNPRTGLDQALSSGEIDATLPYIKREGMRLLWNSYPDETAADAEIEGLRDFYQSRYPETYRTKAAQINSAIDRMQVLYRLTATPEMKVTAETYPNNLGHLDFAGCFRCHDGGHFLVVDGVATAQTIPSSCNACHTFPQLGPAVASLPLGQPPSTHVNDSLWVFNHKDVAPDLDPGGNSCGECHARDYCVNCHATGAVTVDHDTMATNHAAVIRAQGNQACAYCHQPVYCARCHSDPVLPVTTPFLHGSADTTTPAPGATPSPEPATEGAAWPLAPHT